MDDSTRVASQAVRAVKEHPQLYATDFVNALREGRKTMTRRPVKWKPRDPGLNLAFSGLRLGYYCTDVPQSGYVLRSRDGHGCWNDRTWPLHPPIQVGDKIWVREKWAYACATTTEERDVVYWAGITDPPGWPTRRGPYSDFCKWRPSIHMPRWAARIILEVTSVRCERIQAITEEDILAEGFTHGEGIWEGSMRAAFSRKWDSMYAKTCPWADNGFVFVYGLKVLEGLK